MLSADMPVKFLGKRFGAGVNALTESYGLYKTLAIDAQLGFKLRKWGGEFTAALNLGMYDQSFKGSEIYIPEGDDYQTLAGYILNATGTIPAQGEHVVLGELDFEILATSSSKLDLIKLTAPVQ